MSRRDKLLQRLRDHPRGCSFSDVDAALRAYGFDIANVRGSHVRYKHETGIAVTVIRRPKPLRPYVVGDSVTAIEEVLKNEEA